MANKKKKGFRLKSRQQHCSSTKVSNRSAVRKQWSDVQMEAALESVIKDGLSQNQAADLHGVPRSTLKDRLSGRVVHGINPGPQSYLSSSEELEFLVDTAKMGYGQTRRDVKCLVETHLQINGKKGENFTVSNGWWDRFLSLSGPLASSPSGPPMCPTGPSMSVSSTPMSSHSGHLVSSPSGPLMCPTGPPISGPLASSLSGPPMSPSSPPMSLSGHLASSLSGPLMSPSSPPISLSGPLASSLSDPPIDVSGPLTSSPSGPVMCSTGPPMSFSGPLMSLSGPSTSSPSGPSMNVSGPLVSSPSGPSMNVSGPPVSSPSGPSVNVSGPSVYISGPLVSSPSGPSVNVPGPLASSPSGSDKTQ